MEIETLRESLSQYESQLSQVKLALEVTPKGEEYDSLASLQSDLQELIDLTNENIQTLNFKSNNEIVESTNNATDEKQNNPLDDEYALFMNEMMSSGAYDKEEKKTNNDLENNTTESSINDIEEELSSVQGMKCSVLFCHKLGSAPSSYNAMVSSVIRENIEKGLDFDNIQVRVMFTNPTHIEMVPCPYYLEGSCKFSDELCRFSHGEIVALSSLKEAIEPDFSSLKPGSRVLANIKQDEEACSSKSSDKYLLWHRAIITNVASEDHVCHVRLEQDILSKGNNKNHYKVDFGFIFPLSDDFYDSGTDSDSSSDLSYQPACRNDDMTDSINDEIVQKSLLNNPGSVMLGDWEKHTKGIGSKIMMKMGYVTGTGLGPLADGIIQPIPCSINPAGRSLDHCMELRECSDDPVKAEKKLRRLKKKQEQQEKRAYEKAKSREESGVFNFLNKTLSAKSQSDFNIRNDGGKEKSSQSVKEIKESSCKNLNIEQFKLAEDIKKIEKDIDKLKCSIVRNKTDSDVKRGLNVQLNSKIGELNELKSKQKSISNEQNFRKDKKKMSVF